VPTVLKSGSLDLLEPSGPVHAFLFLLLESKLEYKKFPDFNMMMMMMMMMIIIIIIIAMPNAA
jgi:uncharacterized membrane protein